MGDIESTVVRVERLEKDVSKLQENDEEKSRILTRMDVASGKAEVYQEQIMSNLASITSSVAKTLDKATQTEILAFNLKVVTDKQTVDLAVIDGEVKATKKKVTDIELLPAKNATRTKWIMITILAGNGIAIIGIIIKYGLMLLGVL